MNFASLKDTCYFTLLILIALGTRGKAQIPDSALTKNQRYSCGGIVFDEKGNALSGVTIVIRDLNLWTTTNASGHFSIFEIPRAKCSLEIRYLGYATQTVPINFEEIHPHRNLEIILHPGSQILNTVKIAAKSVSREVAESPIQTQVLNTTQFHEQPISLVGLLNQSAGIRVRQTGALGAPGNILINGFQNRAIRYFKDDIPMDYLGGGFDISLVPVNMMDRIEVYKGVLPSKLGADALGGALNLVTRKNYGQNLDFSYETGSFNTHRASLNAYYSNDSAHLFAGVDAFYNYSDNDYQVDVQITDRTTSKQYDATVNLFHNRFRNYYTEIYGGLAGVSWANELRVGVTAFQIDRQINFGSSMHQAIGAATNAQHSIIPTLRYQHSLFSDRFKIDQFLTANVLNANQVDTAQGQYNWLGEFFPTDSRKGELNPRGSLADLEYHYYTSRTHLGYEWSPDHKLYLSAVFSGFSRMGEDPLGQRFINTDIDVLSKEAVYHKAVFSMGLNSNLIGDKLSNQLAVKHFRYRTNATDADYSGHPIHHQNNNQAWGIAEALKYIIKDQSIFRISGEMALRLPEQDEIFGDGDRKLANFALKPERSLNFNASYRLNTPNDHYLEINSFYRITQDMILLLPFNLIYSQSKNVDNVRGFGIEMDGLVKILPWLSANGNFTIQDLRLFDTNNPTSENAKLRNTPYFFSNFSIQTHFSDLFNEGDQIQIYWHYQFVREYYLDIIPQDKEPDGFLGLWGRAGLDARNIIPNQNIHNLGITWHPFDDKLSAGFQIRNIFDTPAFDHFRVQNAGRSFHLKLRYHFSKIQ